MKIKVTRRLHPVGTQRRYRVTCNPAPRFPEQAFTASGDILPDVMGPLPAWAFPLIDRAFTHIRDARPWSVRDESVTITIEIK